MHHTSSLWTTDRTKSPIALLEFRTKKSPSSNPFSLSTSSASILESLPWNQFDVSDMFSLWLIFWNQEFQMTHYYFEESYQIRWCQILSVRPNLRSAQVAALSQAERVIRRCFFSFIEIVAFSEFFLYHLIYLNPITTKNIKNKQNKQSWALSVPEDTSENEVTSTFIDSN